MSKRKYPSELNTRTVRVNLSTWLLLKEFSQKQGISMAELVDQLLTDQDYKEPVSPTQTRLPIEIVARSMPVAAARSTPVGISFSREVKSDIRYRQTNGK